MATVLPAKNPRNLLQRRLSQAQYDAMDMAGVMSTFSMAFRPETAAATTHLQFLHNQQLQHRLAAMAPDQLVRPPPHPTTVGVDNAFANPYGVVGGGLHSASFGSLHWAPVGGEQYIKTEEPSPVPPTETLYDARAAHGASSPSPASPAADSSDDDDDGGGGGGGPAVFATDIDALMRTIQSKSEPTTEPQPQPHLQSAAAAADFLDPTTHPTTATTATTTTTTTTTTKKKRYTCPAPSCGKAFHQRTHLEIHTRAHTGIKPFACPSPGCGRRFSQQGNLKTHARRHTGERPYRCGECGKSFAQHGNVRAHAVVHAAAKPFACRLDACGKRFTQLGNLKSHQNKFHAATIRRLRDRFEHLASTSVSTTAAADANNSADDHHHQNHQHHQNQNPSPARRPADDDHDRELWDYFAALYKNCNKGIKGRGKERRIDGGGGGGSGGAEVQEAKARERNDGSSKRGRRRRESADSGSGSSGPGVEGEMFG